MIWRMLFAAGLVLAAVGSETPVAANDAISLRTDCPRSGKYKACMKTRLYVPTRSTSGPEPLTSRVALLTGNLLGHDRSTFRLLREVEQNSRAARVEDEGYAAYLGRSRRNRPLVLTDRGPFEIAMPRFDIDIMPSVVILRGPSLKTVARYYDTPAPLFDVRGKAIEVWESVAGRCVSAMTRTPGLLKLRKGGCEILRDRMGRNGMPSNFSPATSIPLERIVAAVPDLKSLYLDASDLDKAEYGGAGWGVRIFNVTGTPYVAVVATCNDPCD